MFLQHEPDVRRREERQVRERHGEFARRRTEPPAQRGAGPTLEDYQALRTAYLELKVSAETLAKDLEARKSEIAIQKDALHKQGEDLKKTQSELMWTKAALQAAEAANAEPDRESWQDRYTRLQAEVENLRRHHTQLGPVDHQFACMVIRSSSIQSTQRRPAFTGRFAPNLP